MWAGSHHLHYTALPQWVQTLGMTFSVMLLVPSWASAANALAHPERRLAQGARRRDAALHDGRRRVLRAHDLRGLVHGDPRGELAVALHRLDGRPRPCRRAGLGGDDHLRLDLRRGAVAVEAREHVLAAAGRGAFLVRARRHRRLRAGDVELRHHPGADVADLQRQRHARLFLHRFAGRDASLLHRARDRRPAVPDRRVGRLLQRLDDGARTAPPKPVPDRQSTIPSRRPGPYAAGPSRRPAE